MEEKAKEQSSIQFQLSAIDAQINSISIRLAETESILADVLHPNITADDKPKPEAPCGSKLEQELFSYGRRLYDIWVQLDDLNRRIEL